jgi:hypothetical protein
MVKAAPRFATILCLCYVRLNAFVSSRNVHTAGWAAASIRQYISHGKPNIYTYIGNANWGQTLSHGEVLGAT